MLTSAALVLLMTGPGLALFYGGLVRRKNVLSTMMHSFIMMGLITVIWALVGYSLVFSEGTPFIGGLKYAFLNGVGTDPNADYGATIPQGTYMIYQLMFAIITPALISGAYAERMKFSAMALFTTLWAFVVYFPMAHMVWGKGGLLNAYLGGSSPHVRFRRRHGGAHHLGRLGAGLRAVSGQARRLSAGADEAAQHGAERDRRVSAVGRLVRLQRGQRDWRPPDSPPALLSLRISRPPPPRSAGWPPSGCKCGKPSMLGGISGAVAGLVAITPASGFVKPMPALLIGVLAGVFCFLMVTAVKHMFGYDDTLDAFGVHGAGGTLGALLTGVFATNVINNAPINGKVIPLGLVDGNPGQILNQAIGVADLHRPRRRRHVRYPQDLRCADRRARRPRCEEQGLDLTPARRRRLRHSKRSVSKLRGHI